MWKLNSFLNRRWNPFLHLNTAFFWQSIKEPICVFMSMNITFNNCKGYGKGSSLEWNQFLFIECHSKLDFKVWRFFEWSLNPTFFDKYFPPWISTISQKPKRQKSINRKTRIMSDIDERTRLLNLQLFSFIKISTLRQSDWVME